MSNELNTRMIFAVIAVVAACGCVSNDCSGKLAILELFGAKLDEPWGGELPLNGGGGGADFVSEWLDFAQWNNLRTNDVQLSRFCCRGYAYYASADVVIEDPGGPFDGKSGWMVSEIADKSTGMILEVYGIMNFSTHYQRRGHKDDCVRKNGIRLKAYLEEILGPVYGNRCLDIPAYVGDKPTCGGYRYEYTWRRGCQTIRLSLSCRDGKDGYDGDILLDVFRTDMGVQPVE